MGSILKGIGTGIGICIGVMFVGFIGLLAMAWLYCSSGVCA